MSLPVVPACHSCNPSARGEEGCFILPQARVWGKLLFLGSDACFKVLHGGRKASLVPAGIMLCGAFCPHDLDGETLPVSTHLA